MYKVGKYTYKSAKHYQMLLVKVWLVFLVCFFLLIWMRDSMATLTFQITLLIDMAMLIHLPLRIADSRKVIKYIFREI